MPPDPADLADAPVSLDRDIFLRSLLRELAGALEHVVGIEEASGYISLVGATIGRQINADYRHALRRPRLGRDQVAAVLVDLKRRIEGGFSIVAITDEVIELRNTRCPFGDKVLGRGSMCMMTSNVFGFIAADNLGYAKVELRETIAAGAAECRVLVHLQPSVTASFAEGREYLGTAQDAD